MQKLTAPHWTVLVVLTTVSVWNFRYFGRLMPPLRGWPIFWNNLWYLGQDQWSLKLLLVDVSLWLLLAGATVNVVERFRHLSRPFQFSLVGLLSMQAVVAVLIVIGLAESYLRRSPGNNVIFPRYGQTAVFGPEVWFDIGLFTDASNAWLLVRIPLIFFIGCAIYSLPAFVRLVGTWAAIAGARMAAEISDFAEHVRMLFRGNRRQ